VSPICTATNTPGRPIKVGRLPRAIAITPDGKTAYVVNWGAGTVTPIQTATNTPGKPITVGPYPVAIAITP
jgi:YVTN family beta-propeller protein